jgi:hypothetical protein
MIVPSRSQEIRKWAERDKLNGREESIQSRIDKKQGKNWQLERVAVVVRRQALEPRLGRVRQ